MKAVLLLAVLVSVLWQATPPLIDGGTVEGFVFRSDSLRGIADARVTLSGPAADPVVPSRNRSAPTDTDGRFLFTDIPPGRYVLRAVSAGFFAEGIGGTPLTVLAGERKSNITLLLDPGATLKGFISDSDGKALPDVRIVYFRPMLDGLMAGPNPISVASAKTDRNGEYELGGLPSGEYYVQAQFTDKRSEKTYRSTYYPDALEVARARRVFVPLGATVTGIDIQVQRTALVTVSGRVDRKPGGKGEDLAVRFVFYPRDANTPSEMMNSADATMNPVTGEFQIRNVLPGAYTLFVYEEGTSGHRGQSLIDVADADLQGVSVVLLPPIQLVGRVIGLPRTVSPFVSRVFLGTNRALHRPAGTRNVNGQIDEEGRFVFEYVTEGASYFFMPFDPIYPVAAEGFYIRDIRQGRRSILETGIVTASSPPEAIEITVSPGGGAITGVVRNQTLAKNAAYIFLLPSGSRRQNRALYKRAQSDDAGRFTISGITPGAYKLFAWETEPDLGALDFGFVLRYEDRGLPLTIREGEEINNVAVSVIPRGQ